MTRPVRSIFSRLHIAGHERFAPRDVCSAPTTVPSASLRGRTRAQQLRQCSGTYAGKRDWATTGLPSELTGATAGTTGAHLGVHSSNKRNTRRPWPVLTETVREGHVRLAGQTVLSRRLPAGRGGRHRYRSCSKLPVPSPRRFFSCRRGDRAATEVMRHRPLAVHKWIARVPKVVFSYARRTQKFCDRSPYER
jgi:hypothetical protein